MPSYLDLGLIAVVLISALLSMVRGFTREVLAIISWGAAAAAAYYLHPMLLPYLKPYIPKESIQLAVAVAAVFLVTLVVISIITVKVSDAILDSKVGALDRTLGFLFGAGRGFVLCVVAFMMFTWLLSGKPLPEWAANAKTKPVLESTSEQVKSMLPADVQKMLFDALNKAKRGTPDEPVQEPDAAAPPPAAPGGATPPAPPPSPPAPLKKTDATPPAPAGQTASDKQKLDAIAAAAAAAAAKPKP